MFHCGLTLTLTWRWRNFNRRYSLLMMMYCFSDDVLNVNSLSLYFGVGCMNSDVCAPSTSFLIFLLCYLVAEHVRLVDLFSCIPKRITRGSCFWYLLIISLTNNTERHFLSKLCSTISSHRDTYCFLHWRGSSLTQTKISTPQLFNRL